MTWLSDYVKPGISSKDYANAMTMSGSKVEAVHLQAHDISGVVVGKVLKIEKHSNADSLFVTQIDAGKHGTLQIVTGAKNLFEGAIVPVAIHGAVLVGGLEIKKGKLRGEESAGMLCSVEELGFTRNDYPEAPEDGIYIFTENSGVAGNIADMLGEDAVDVLQMREEIVEFEITPNRSDCFSVIGLTRETAATLGIPYKYPTLSTQEAAGGNVNELISIEIQNPELCPRYAARVVKNVKIAPSPLWMRKRLTAAGIRPVNNIVDITNYVMHELGQPMHAFDIRHVADAKIIVRKANEGENFTTLDGVERKLNSSMLVIADPKKALAVAGVMGGENSMVTNDATTILLESANFNGTSVRLTSKKLGLRTDASAKFEKGLDPNLAEAAVNRAAHLIETLACGDVVTGIADCYPVIRTEWTVPYKLDSINALLGTHITEAEFEQLLNSLEIVASGGVAKIPTFRPDITQEADLAEEVARLYGYDKIEETLAAGTATVGKKTDWQNFCDKIKDVLVAQGFCEALTYSFESPKVFDKLLIPDDHKIRTTVNIINPLGEDYSIMRTQTSNSMLTALSTNYNRRNDDAALFEIAKEYTPSADASELPGETTAITIGAYGNSFGDFYKMKGVAETLLEALGIAALEFEPYLGVYAAHPGRSAKISTGNTPLGFICEVHPIVAQNYEIGIKAYLITFNAHSLFGAADLNKVYKPVPKFPAVKRDIAVVVNGDLPVRKLERAIESIGSSLTENILESVKLFDVYQGKGVVDGMKSVAYSITFRATDRTLTDAEVTDAFVKITTALQEKFDATIRA